MGEARRRQQSGTNPNEKIPKTYLWPRRFTDDIRQRFGDACRVAKAAQFPAPSEDAFVKAALTAGFAKMDADIAAARAAREERRIVTPTGPVDDEMPRIVLVDR